MTNLFSEFNKVTDAAAWGAASFTFLYEMPVAAGVERLKTVKSRRTVLVR
jgi:hypothetical protein